MPIKQAIIVSGAMSAATLIAIGLTQGFSEHAASLAFPLWTLGTLTGTACWVIFRR